MKRMAVFYDFAEVLPLPLPSLPLNRLLPLPPLPLPFTTASLDQPVLRGLVLILNPFWAKF